ncbi:SIS domain-containing protein [Priestia aryabhattai]|uniref:SIS domain-containing protein n=1 Tax=Priestia aryabhattai TaxID=412384 RepID=UPI003D2D7553
MSSLYLQELTKLLAKVETHEQQAIESAAEKISQQLASHHLIHLFGCGHSHILTEEVFYRSGGLAPIHPIFIEELMLHKGASRSSQLERKNNYASTFMEKEDIVPGDIMIVISTSGVNPVPIDVALIAKEKGAFVIGLTSPSYATSRASRHKSGKYLHDVVDLVINNHIPKGDVLLHQQDISFASGSTVIGGAILNDVLSKAIQKLLSRGITPPVFLSGNMEGSDEHNQRLIDAYKGRITAL